VKEEVRKECLIAALVKEEDTTAEAFYGFTVILNLSYWSSSVKRNATGRSRSISLSELKEFTYWLFQYRIRHNDKSRVASDTKKALDWLNRNGYPERFIITRPLVGISDYLNLRMSIAPVIQNPGISSMSLRDLR